MIVSIDAGTTGVRAVAVRDDTTVAGVAYREFPQYFPQPGWIEHDPIEIWNAVRAVIRDVLRDLDEPVAGVGIANQRETVVAWDRVTLQPLHHAIVWQDRRTSAQCKYLIKAGHEGEIRRRTGLGADPYFSATKISWLLRNTDLGDNPNLSVGTIDTWLVAKLSDGAVHVTDHSNASRTLLYDIDKLQWSSELLDLFDVPRKVMAEVRPSSARVALTDNVTALGAGVPISGIAGDQQAALFGQACFQSGMAKNTYGTGSFVLMNAGEKRPRQAAGLLTTIAWTLADSRPVYAYEGSVFASGAAIQWLRDGLELIRHPSEVGPLAETVPTTGGVCLVPAFSGLGTPWWDPDARGVIVGLTRGTGRAEIARATLESIAYQVRGVVDAMTSGSGASLAELRVDGGASAIELLLQLQSDQLGVPVVRSKVRETTALGAALLAGLAEGVWDSCDDVAARWSADFVCAPQTSTELADNSYAEWLRAAERSLGWARETSGQ